MKRGKQYLVTPNGHYLVVINRLWRLANPSLTSEQKNALVHRLMAARRAVRAAETDEDKENARAAVHTAKLELGERGAPWWKDGERDYNRHLVKNTPYALWYKRVSSEE